MCLCDPDKPERLQNEVEQLKDRLRRIAQAADWGLRNTDVRETVLQQIRSEAQSAL